MKLLLKRLIALVVVSCALSSFSHAASVGDPAPGFELTDINGETHSLSDFLGKTVVLEWINLGCPFVRKHYDSENMQKLQRYSADKDVVWLAICSSAPGKQGNMNSKSWQVAYEKEGMASAAVLIDEDGQVGRLYRARATPHMYVIDPEGQLVYNGAIDSIRSASPRDIGKATNYVMAALESVFAGEPVKSPANKPYGCSVKY